MDSSLKQERVCDLRLADKRAVLEEIDDLFSFGLAFLFFSVLELTQALILENLLVGDLFSETDLLNPGSELLLRLEP